MGTQNHFFSVSHYKIIDLLCCFHSSYFTRRVNLSTVMIIYSMDSNSKSRIYNLKTKFKLS